MILFITWFFFRQ